MLVLKIYVLRFTVRLNFISILFILFLLTFCFFLLFLSFEKSFIFFYILWCFWRFSSEFGDEIYIDQFFFCRTISTSIYKSFNNKWFQCNEMWDGKGPRYWRWKSQQIKINKSSEWFPFFKFYFWKSWFILQFLEFEDLSSGNWNFLKIGEKISVLKVRNE